MQREIEYKPWQIEPTRKDQQKVYVHDEQIIFDSELTNYKNEIRLNRRRQRMRQKNTTWTMKILFYVNRECACIPDVRIVAYAGIHRYY